MPKLIPIFLALALALFIVGCGGSGATTAGSNAADTTTSPAAGEGSPSSEGPLTRAEFIKQGDAICAKADETIYDEGRKYRTVHAKELSKLEPVPREEKLIRLVVLPTVLREARGLEGLPAPKGDEKQIESLIAGIEAGVKKAQKNPYAIEGEFGYGENPFHKVDVRLRNYGFQYCNLIT